MEKTVLDFVNAVFGWAIASGFAVVCGILYITYKIGYFSNEIGKNSGMKGELKDDFSRVSNDIKNDL